MGRLRHEIIGENELAQQACRVRKLLIGLIRARRVKYGAPPKRPARISYLEAVNPESGMPLTRSGMWYAIDQALNSGVPLEPVTLRRPPGERGWTLKFPMASEEPLVYVQAPDHRTICRPAQLPPLGA